MDGLDPATDGKARSSWLQLGVPRQPCGSPIWTCSHRWASYLRF